MIHFEDILDVGQMILNEKMKRNVQKGVSA